MITLFRYIDPTVLGSSHLVNLVQWRSGAWIYERSRWKEPDPETTTSETNQKKQINKLLPQYRNGTTNGNLNSVTKNTVPLDSFLIADRLPVIYHKTLFLRINFWGWRACSSYFWPYLPEGTSLFLHCVTRPPSCVLNHVPLGQGRVVFIMGIPLET